MGAPGTIAYCSREDQIYPGFAAALGRLLQRHPDAEVIQMVSNDIADARNAAVKQMSGEWLWFIDTDMLFAPTTVERLLAHQVDLVQVLCLKRHPPHEPILWERSEDEQQTAPSGRPRLVEVHSLGAGGTLYRRRVFDAIQYPWFEGILGKEDICFARKAKAAGFRLFVDTATPVGHTTPMVVWPEYDPRTGRWCIRYDAMNGRSCLLPTLDDARVLIQT